MCQQADDVDRTACLCSSDRPGERCSEVQEVARRLRIIGDHLQERAQSKAADRIHTNVSNKHLYTICTLVHVTALFILIRNKHL